MSRSRIRLIVLLGMIVLAAPAWASPIASRSAGSDETTDDLVSSVARDLGGHEQLARALAAHGLSPEEIDDRLSQLRDEDLRYLSANLDQVHAAGNVPDYIWILLAVFLGVLIVGAIF